MHIRTQSIIDVRGSRIRIQGTKHPSLNQLEPHRINRAVPKLLQHQRAGHPIARVTGYEPDASTTYHRSVFAYPHAIHYDQ